LTKKQTNTAFDFFWISLVSLLFLAKTTAVVAEPIVAEGSIVDLSKHLSIYEDAYNTLSIDSFLDYEFSAFRRLDSTEINIDYTFSSFWLRFSLTNEKESNEIYFLHIDNPDLNTVSFFETERSNLLREIHTGERQPFAKRDLKHRDFIFELPLPANSTRTYYVKINNDGEAAFFSLKINKPDALIADESSSDIFLIAYGALGFIVVLSLYLLVVLKNWLYFIYAIYVLASVGALANLHGYPALHLWPTSPWFADHSGAIFSFLANFTLILFVQRFLDLKRRKPSLHRITNIYLGLISTILIFGIAPSPMVMVSHVINALCTLLTFLLVPSCAIASLKTYRYRAIYILASYTPLTAAVIAYFLRITGAIGGQPPVAWLDFGLSFQLFVLSFALIEGFRHEQSGMIKKLAAQNREMESLTTAARESDNGIAILARDGIIEWCNSVFEKIHLLSPEQDSATNKLHISSLVGHEQTSEHMHLAADSKISQGYGIHLEQPDGNTVWLQATITPLVDTEGQVYRFVVIESDLTSQKQADEEKRKLHERLLQSQKLETLGTLAGGVAHSFNNLLMAIQGQSTMILLETGQKNPIYQRATMIEECVRSGAELSSQLLGFARKGAYELVTLDINQLAQRSIKLFQTTRKEYLIDSRLSDISLPADVDSTQFEQVFLNLFNNAALAMPKGGTIRVASEIINILPIDSQKYRVEPGKYAKVSVSDKGVGMNEETRQRVFEPFFTTRDIGKGTGLGLASVYGILRSHGGYIEVYSELGLGTTFSFYVPISEKEAIEKISFEEPEITTGAETILLVDDEPMVSDVATEILKTLGYSVHVAGNGDQAIEIFNERHSEIDLIILDMIMPGKSGVETFKELRSIEPDIKVLLSSGYSLDQQAQGVMTSGFSGFIQKPYTISRLSAKLDELLH
jgi:PAS domain S-box-containing protein